MAGGSCLPLCMALVAIMISAGAVAFADATNSQAVPRSLQMRLLLQEHVGNATSLTASEIDVIIAKLQQSAPEAFAGHNVAELRQQLASLNVTLLGVEEDLSATDRLDTVASRIFAGLTPPKGTPGQTAPTPPEAAVNVTLFSPPEDCPGWSCVCTDKPDKSRVVAPDNCQAYITCDGRGNGTKSLCTIAGTGFHQETGECKPLDGPPDADNKCNFANGTDGGVAAASDAGGDTVARTYSCKDLLASAGAVNLAASTESGQNGCAPATPTKPARFEVKASSPSKVITSVLLRYMEQGPSTPITLTSARGAANITGFRAHRQAIRNRVSKDNSTGATAGVQQAGLQLWQPRVAVVSFTRQAGAVVVTVPRLEQGARLLLLSAEVTEGNLTAADLQAGKAPSSVPNPSSEAEPVTGVEVPLVPGPLANFGIASETPLDSEDVSAQSLAGIGKVLKSVSGSKWWQQVENANDIAGYLNTAVEILAAPREQDLTNYVKAYQNILLGASDCYRNSYGRGVGTIPADCGDWQNEAGICYERCGGGYYPVWFVCWQHCPSWAPDDHGVLCHRPMHSYWNENRGWCGWWDICATWDRRDCRECATGYDRHGCICTRPPLWHAKHSYVRPSRLPGCPAGQEWQSGLCYQSCGEHYWGDGPICYNYCNDAFPHDCGAGLCSKSADTCRDFVKNAIFSALNLVISAVSAVAGGPTAIAQALIAAGETVQFFGATKTCADSMIHLRSSMAVLTVRDREFQGQHIAAFDGADWDGCLISCKRNSACKAVIFNRNIRRCQLLSRIGAGDHGRHAHAPGVDVGVAVMRLDGLSASWQFSVGRNIILPGSFLMPHPTTPVIRHRTATGGMNLALCQMACVEKSCDFIAYGDTACVLMNRAAAGVTTVDPRSIPDMSKRPPVMVATGVHSIMVNMAKWTDWDANGVYPVGI